MYQKIYNHFLSFISKKSSFSDTEKKYIIEGFQNPVHRRVFRLAVILLLWSIAGGFIDSVLIGGGVVASGVNGAVQWSYFIPEIIFFLLNTSAKILFVIWYMRGNFSYRDLCFCGIPYAGSALLIGVLLHKDRLLAKALRYYMIFLRKQGVRKNISLVKK